MTGARPGPGLGAMVREILAAAWAQRVSTIVTALIIGGSALTILLTSGRSAAAEAAVLASIDAQGTRSVTVMSKGEDPALTRAMVDELRRLPEVADVVAFGPVEDVTAAAIPDGTRVGKRTAYGILGGSRVEQRVSDLGPQAWVTSQAAHTLGMPPGARSGAVRVVDGEEYQITRALRLPEYLQGLEPAVIVPASREAPLVGEGGFAMIAILARTPESVSLVNDYARSLLVDLPRESVTVSTSEQMAELRRVVGGQLTAQGRAIVMGVLGGATLATLVNVWGMALMRRRDIGRRRALGATRSMIVGLMVGQVAVAALLAAVVGALIGMGVLVAGDGPVPRPSYVVALVVALTGVASVSAGIPALLASRRDPLTELRVP